MIVGSMYDPVMKTARNKTWFCSSSSSLPQILQPRLHSSLTTVVVVLYHIAREDCQFSEDEHHFLVLRLLTSDLLISQLVPFVKLLEFFLIMETPDFLWLHIHQLTLWLIYTIYFNCIKMNDISQYDLAMSYMVCYSQMNHRWIYLELMSAMFVEALILL